MCICLILKDDFRLDRESDHNINKIYLWGTLIKWEEDNILR